MRSGRPEWRRKKHAFKGGDGPRQDARGKDFLFRTSRLKNAQERIAYIPQRESVDWDFPITAEDVVLMGRYNRFGFFGRPRIADRDAAARALDQLGMTPYADRQISQLSGGQQQRLFVARALTQEPDIFLMDEPFSGIDLATEHSIIEILMELKKSGKTILIVFHDLSNAEKYFDYLLLLNRRLIACGPIAETLKSDCLSRTFGTGPAIFEEATRLSVKTQIGDE